MLIDLMKYEFIKRWKASRYVLLGYILLQIALLAVSGAFFWNGNMAKVFTEKNFECQNAGTSSVIAMLLYFIAALLIVIYPFVEGITRFNKDLSGRQSVLEHMIPVKSWKKIVSKLITVLCSTIIGAGLGALSVITFVLLSSSFDRRIVDGILNTLHTAFQSPGLLILDILYILFCFLSMYVIIYFCIAFSKVFSHKSKIAVPIGMVTFILIIVVLANLSTLLQRIPIVHFTILASEDSLSSIIMSVLVFLAALYGTSWLMDNKVEH